MSRDSADDNQHLPPWLRGVPLPPRPPGQADLGGEPPRPAQGAPAASSPAGNEETPSWLSELSAAADAEPAAPVVPSTEEMPSWLSELSAAVEPDVPAAPAAPAAEEMPSWLSELSAAADAEPAAPGAEATPSWLGNLADRSASTAGGADLPDWLRGAETEPPQSPAHELSSQPEAESGFPDWLRSEAAAPPPTPAADAEPPPAWLASLVEETSETAAPPAQPHTVEPDTIPGRPREQDSSGRASRSDADAAALWLDNKPADAAPPTPPAGADEADIPSWLRDIPTDEIRRVMAGDDEEEITVEPFSFEDAAGASQDAPATNMPAWLADIAGEASGQADAGPSWLGDMSPEPSKPAGASEAPEVPLWLQDLDAAPASALGASVPAESSAEEHVAPPAPQGEIPAWVGDVAPAQPPASNLPAWLQVEPAGDAPSPALPSWLKEEAPAAPPPSDVPVWLKEQPPAEATPTAPPAESMPAWLQAEPPAEALPSWLKAEPPASPAPSWSHTDVDSTPAAAAPPPWLNDALPSAPSVEVSDQSAPPPLPPADDLPAWLREDALAPPAADDLPNWLSPRAPAEPPRAEPPAPAADELPPWLRDEAGQPLPTAGTPGDANLPEWLRGATGQPATAEITPLDRGRAEPPAPPTAPAPVGLDWFDEGQSAADRPPASESEFFGGAELPAWLRKAEAEPAAEISPTDARSLDWLARLGAQDEENAAPVAAPLAKLPLPARPARTESQLRAVTLLERLAAEPYPEAAPLPVPPAPTIWRRIGLERMLYVVLLVALLAALAVPTLAANLQTPPQAPGAAELFQRVNTLTDKDVVLIGYEWDARRLSELKPLEQAVIGQLIQKHVNLVLISTDPQGTLLLFDLRDKLEEAGYRGGGEDYILLGYKPGGELALRALVQDFQAALSADFQGNDATQGALAGGLKTGKPLTSLEDISMILVLADDAADVQSWVEQVRRSVPQQPLAFLLPAETAPIVQPYLQPPRDPRIAPIYHLAGKQGALAYEQLRGAEHTPAVQIEREMGQQRLSILVFVVLLVIGGAVVGVGGAVQRRTGA